MIELAVGIALFVAGGIVARRRGVRPKPRVASRFDPRCSLGRHAFTEDADVPERLISIEGTGPVFAVEMFCARCGIRSRSFQPVPDECELDRAEAIRLKLRAAESANGRAALGAAKGDGHA